MDEALKLIDEIEGMVTRMDGGGDHAKVEQLAMENVELRRQLEAAENTFISLYKRGTDALDRVAVLEDENERLEGQVAASRGASAREFELSRRIAQLEGECERLRVERDDYKERYELGQLDRDLLDYLREHERYTVERAVSDLSGPSGGRVRLGGMI